MNFTYKIMLLLSATLNRLTPSQQLKKIISCPKNLQMIQSPPKSNVIRERRRGGRGVGDEEENEQDVPERNFTLQNLRKTFYQ
jgi:hypothetical protein